MKCLFNIDMVGPWHPFGNLPAHNFFGGGSLFHRVWAGPV